ncbi:MAG: hypothetical protein JWO98_5331 [Frankiales bacterium]|nr:hypothetical protein [Frankiales bacterium]
MSAFTGPFRSDAEKVAIAWTKKHVTGIDVTKVASVLPDKEPVFLQIRALLARTAVRDVNAMRSSGLQVDAWAASASSRPQWGDASQLIERFKSALDEDQAFGETLDLGPNFLPVRVQALYADQEPRRVEGDPSGYARFTMDVFMDWIQ